MLRFFVSQLIILFFFLSTITRSKMSAADRLQSILSTIPSGNDIPPPAHSPPSTSATTPSPSDPRIQAILNTINTAEKAGKYLYQDINSIISPEDWTPEIATALLVGLKDRLCSEWKDQGPILKEALQNTAEKLVGVWGNVDEDNAPPFLAILFTFGVMNMVVPYEVMEALGYDNQMAGRALIEGMLGFCSQSKVNKIAEIMACFFTYRDPD